MLQILRRMKRPDVFRALSALLFISLQVWLDLALPETMSTITRLIITPGSSLREVWSCGARMLLFALGSGAASVAVGYLAARISSNFSYSLRGEVFSRVSEFGAREMKSFSTASLITRTTNDITQVQLLISMGLQVVVRAPIMAVWAILKIVGKSWQLSLVVAGAVLLMLCVILFLMRLVLPRFRIIQHQIDQVNRIARENLTGLRIVRAFNAEDYQMAKFDRASAALMKTQLYTSRRLAVLMPFIGLSMNVLSLAIYWTGALLINGIAPVSAEAVAARISLFSEVVVFFTYAMFVVLSFMMLVLIFMMLPRAQVSAGRILEVLSTSPEVREGSGAHPLEKGTLSFRHVSFRYPDALRDCLHDLTFEVRSGETVAFIGATGSGKTTLVSLAARLYDATGGKILLDGKDIRSYTFRQLSERIALVSQKAVLLSGSIRENLTFGNAAAPFTAQDCERALDISQSLGFVSSLQDGMDAHVAQGGANFSGGQRQRLSIARALARKPEILIFDDSFSALDYRTDAALRRRLEEEMKGTTRLIVAQRIGTIRHADRIVVLEEGRIAGIGTHDALMRECAVYREIALSQLSRAELEVG